jgi:hypothetical protein
MVTARLQQIKAAFGTSKRNGCMADVKRKSEPVAGIFFLEIASSSSRNRAEKCRE